MNDLLCTHVLLADLMHADPLLCLAHAVVWLDPLWSSSDEFEDDNSLRHALHVTRTAFPEIYAGAVERLKLGANERELDRYLCAEITKRGIPLEDMDALGYGIPLYAHGIDLANPEVVAMRPDLLPLVEAFGIDPEAAYTVGVPDIVYIAGRMVADSLVQQDDPLWRQVGWALAWVFSCSGNTLVDFDDEALAEIQPLTWESEDVAFAMELIEEANGILLDADAGLKLLETQPRALQGLTDNVKYIYQKLTKKKGKQREPHIRLEWTPLDLGTD